MNDMPAFTIRSAEPADAPILARLRYDFRSSLDPVTEAEDDFVARCTGWMDARLAPGGAWRCWVAESAGRIVGTVWLQLIEKLPNPVAEAEYHGYISNLYVDPGRRGAGLGSGLLDTCVQFCVHHAVDAILLWPTARSRPLYERHGFAVRQDLFERRLSPTCGHAEPCGGATHREPEDDVRLS
jgi:GNAT superfamily N-acetyltransferase